MFSHTPYLSRGLKLTPGQTPVAPMFGTFGLYEIQPCDLLGRKPFGGCVMPLCQTALGCILITVYKAVRKTVISNDLFGYVEIVKTENMALSHFV